MAALLTAVITAACTPPPEVDGAATDGDGSTEDRPTQRSPMMTEDWTTFRGGLHRLGHRGEPPRLIDPRQLWAFDTGGTVESTPTLWRDLVLVGSFSGHLSAVEAASGTLRWQFTAGGLIRASPSVVDGVVYFGADDDLFYALDAASGEERWRVPLGPGGEQSSPAIVDGVVYFGAFDHHVYAVDAGQGTVRWRYDTGGGLLSSPAVADGVLYIGSANGQVHAVDLAAGTRRWVFQGDDGPIFASPTVADGTVFIGSFDDHMYALNAADGQLRWRRRTGGDIFSTAAVSAGRLYFGADDGFHVLDAATGTPLWQRPLGGRILASPALLEKAGTIYIGTSDDGVLVYDLDGALLDSIDIEGRVWSSVTVAADGRLFFGAHDGFLYAFGPPTADPG